MIVFACFVWIRIAEHSHSSNSRRKLRFSSSSSSVDVDENVELSEEKETEATEKEIESSSSSWIKGEESSGKNSQLEDGCVRSTVARCYDLLNDIDSRIGRIFLRVFGGKNNHGTTAATIVAVDNDYDDTAATATAATAATAIVVDSDDS